MAAPATSHSIGHIRGYSDFFASGFRAVSSGSRRRLSSVCSTSSRTDTEFDSEASSLVFVPSPLPTMHPTRGHRRPMSMIINNTPKPAVDHSTKHNRRSSIVSFSRLFERIPFGSSDENAASQVPAVSSKPKNKRLSRILRSSNANTSAAESQDSWVTAGGPLTPSVPNGCPDLWNSQTPIDPFSSSPDSASFFIDLTPSEAPSSDFYKRESFLSMSTTSNSFTSSSSRSHSLLRPPSFQATSLSPPTQSRRSSFQCRGSSHSSWIIDESFPIFLPEENAPDDAQVSMEECQDMDWRLFHNHLLATDSEA